MHVQHFIAEAKRRHVFRAAGLYAGAAFVILQLADIALPGLGVSDSLITYLLVAAALGFPCVLVVVWVLDLSGEREQVPGRMADALIVLVALAVGYLYVERIFLPQVNEPVAVETTPGERAVGVESVILDAKSIAVLPFENLSPNPDNAYFAAGVHEEVLNQLAKIRELRVIARTTMLRYADGSRSVPEIGKELGVATVMEGSVRYSGNRVRITAQLIDTESGAHLWSEAFEEELVDIFEIQLAIANKIAETTKSEFSLETRERIGSQLSAVPGAYSEYLRAWSLWGNFANIPEIHQALDTAIALDPEFAGAMAFKSWILAGAQAHYGEVFSGSSFNRDMQGRLLTEAEALATRALQLDENAEFAHFAMATIHGYRNEWSSSEKAMQLAYDLSPNHYITVSAGMAAAFQRGDRPEALRLLQVSINLNPADIANLWNSAMLYYQHMQFQKALESADLVTSLLPAAAMGFSVSALIKSRIGNPESVRADASVALSLNPSMIDVLHIARAYRNIGDTQAAEDLYIEWGGADEKKIPSLYWHFWMNLAAGKEQVALDYLERSIELRFPLTTLVELRHCYDHPDYAIVRSDPRFVRALESLDPPEYVEPRY